MTYRDLVRLIMINSLSMIFFKLNLAARAFIAKEIACWEGDPDDIKIERARYYDEDIYRVSFFPVLWEQPG